MSESFLHYLWQYQYFNKADLKTTSGESVNVFATGNKNSHAGPDFYNARIQIGELEWLGCVEIHINSSGWYDHHHHIDPAYENVVLHVVWTNDKPVIRADGTLLPTVELKKRVDEKLILKFKKLISSPEKISCAHTITSISEIIKIGMLDRAVTGRIEFKSSEVLNLLQQNNYDWEETCYQLLAGNFGFKINSAPLLQLAKALPYKLLRKHSNQLIQVEALLFGMAGFLDDKNANDSYYQLLQREYNVLGKKYGLVQYQLNKTQWKFLRLRPANFPTIRLAQFAKLLVQHPSLFSALLEAETYKDLKQILSVKQSDYWCTHYQFGKASKEKVASLGVNSIDNIIINSVILLLAAYAKTKDAQRFLDKAIALLQDVQAETNSITKVWEALEMKPKSAFDSQGVIELYNNFCLKKRCLDCNIGIALLKEMTVG